MNNEIIEVRYFDIAEFDSVKSALEKVKAYEKYIPIRYERSKEYVNDIDKLRCILSGILIYKTYGDVEDKILYNKYKKPYFKDSKMNFSISHSGNYVMIANDILDIGIDIELINPQNIDLLSYAFNDSEKRLIGSSIEEFTRYWTIKESSYKASGSTTIVDIKDIDVSSYADEGRVMIDGINYHIVNKKFENYFVSVASKKKYADIKFIKEYI